QLHLASFTEGLMLGTHNHAIHKTGKNKKKMEKSNIRELILVAKDWKPTHKKQIETASLIADAILKTRTLVNNPPNICSTVTFSKEAEEIAKENHYILKILEKEDLEKFTKQKESAAGKELEVVENSEQEQARGIIEEAIEIVPYHESKELEKTIQAIENYVHSIDSCIGDNDTGKCDYKLVSGENEIPVKSLSDVLSKVREMGRKGLEIQRYKGLGEMNAEELAETTMNINTRTLLKVKVEDAIKADSIFSTLAGKDVQRRREFIEKHALEVRNLDV
ncbi:MAG: DNA gyrase subunit B, partial [Planctomycetota bacterium]